MRKKKPDHPAESQSDQAEVEKLTNHQADTEQGHQVVNENPSSGVSHIQQDPTSLLDTTQTSMFETNQVLVNILSSFHFGVAYLDCDFNFIWVNPAFSVIHRQAQEYFVGKNHFDLFPDPDVHSIFQQVVSTGIPEYRSGMPMRFPQLAERGLTYWNLSIQPVKNQDGQVTGLLLTTVDVTEQKRAELALQESQVLFSQIFEAAPDANLLVDEKGNILAVNRQAEVLFGYERDSLTGYNIRNMIEMQDESPLTQLSFKQIQALVGSEVFKRTLLGVRKNKRTFPIELTLSPVVFANQRSSICVVRDISRRIKAEQALQEQAGFVRLLQDIAVAANEAETVEGALQFAVDRICKFTGWPVGHAIYNDPQHGLVSSGLWHLEDFDRHQIFQKASETIDWNVLSGLPGLIKETGEATWVEDLHSHPDFRRKKAAQAAGLQSAFVFPLVMGKEVVGLLEFYSENYTAPRKDLLEVMTHIGTQLGRVIERDISSRALQRSESRFRAIFEESTVGIQLTDPEGHFVEINPAILAMLGYSASELLQLGLSEVLYPEDVEQNLKNLQALLHGAQDHYQMETRYLRKDGSIMWAQQAVSLIYDPEGKPEFVVTLVVDVSERKKMEAELFEVQSRLGDSLEAERMRLAMELHDGPLQDLYGAIFQLQEIMPSLRDSASMGIARNAQSIIQQVISSLRSTVGELRPPTLIPFGLEKAIRSHIDRWRQIYPNLDIHLDMMSDGLSLSETGRLALFRAYQQLISNVARHSNAKNMWVRFMLSSDEVTLEVLDDGTGFNLPARWVELAREGHTGLIGISERLESFGGSMWVETEPDHGTLVRLTIPRRRIQAQSAGS